jgi:hypothetical protein
MGYTELHILDGVVPVIREQVTVAKTESSSESPEAEASEVAPTP